ncbi:MAG: CaiB/BaiF CoA-transferase family protein [Gammaproteobacteria bacterium]|nr:CaiB/BaiF CoA-transferase family protein [Gammaproteobacteria bacterium]
MNEHLLSGLKVLDVATVIAGPVAATMLADFGADVIKIEEPGRGDLLRFISAIPTTPDAQSNYLWQMDGRNKRSLALNLKSSEGMRVLHRLIERCDVYVTNQPLPVRRNLGLTYSEIKPLNPKMIYASLTAYGEEGPDRDSKAFDLVAYWARSGLMDLVRSGSSVPAQSLPGMGDHPTAVALYAGIMTALLHRERTGEGSMVHTSLLANGLWSASCIAQGALAGGDMEQYRERNFTSGILHRIYPASDGRFLQFTMVRSEEELVRLLAVLGLDELFFDERFATPELRYEHRSVLSALMAEKLLREDSDTWQVRFAETQITVNRVQIVEETVASEQLRVNEMVVPPVDDEMDVPWIINHPVKIDKVTQVGPKRAPNLGEHSREILEELGYPGDEIQLLFDRGVISDSA